MKRFLAALSIIFSMNANAGNLLVVQSNVVRDIYGFELTNNLNFDGFMRVISTNIIDDRNRYSELRTYLYRYIKRAYNRDTMLVIGSSSLEGDFTLINVMDEFDITFTNLPIYVISDNSAVAASRLRMLRTQRETENYFVGTELELTKLVSDLQKEPHGVIFINAFNITNEWNRILTYYEIENRIVKGNKNHVDVGVCGPSFSTSFAVGVSLHNFSMSYEKGTSILCSSLEGVRKWPNFATVRHKVLR